MANAATWTTRQLASVAGPLGRSTIAWLLRTRPGGNERASRRCATIGSTRPWKASLFRLAVVTGIVGICFGQHAAIAHDAPAAVAPPSLPEEISTSLADLDGYRMAAITAGAVVGVIAVNVVTSGVFSPLLAIGTGSAGAAPLTAGVAFFAVREAVWHGLVLVSGPAAVVSVGAPVDAALRDGYTTPGTLALALGESARRAEELVVNAGASIGETVGSWWEGL